MNRLLATVIDFSSASRWCDAARLAQGHKPVGMPASVAAYAHGLGRERHDTNLSGEGPG
jgi:hypothetical protein